MISSIVSIVSIYLWKVLYKLHLFSSELPSDLWSLEKNHIVSKNLLYYCLHSSILRKWNLFISGKSEDSRSKKTEPSMVSDSIKKIVERGSKKKKNWISVCIFLSQCVPENEGNHRWTTFWEESEAWEQGVYWFFH